MSALMFQTPDKSSTPVFISEELGTRSTRAIDPKGENAAMRSLVDAMADKPSELLPLLVQLAADLTGGESAGLSLYEPEPEPGVFRWCHVHGVLAPFENTVVPRDDSPCGVTLDRNAPTLAAHPEAVYDWIAEAGITVPEVLLIPLHLKDEAPLGTLWIIAPRQGHFHNDHARVAAELARFAGIAVRMIRSEQSLRASLEEQEIVAREMSHRLNNMFAVTDSLIHSSARASGSVSELEDMLSGRVHALAAAHSVVKRRVRDFGNAHESVDFADLLGAILKGHEAAGHKPRITLAGPSVRCGDHTASSLALIVHELATNAAKYGALSAQAGEIAIDWHLAADRLVLRWTERGGPAVLHPPERKGFGSTLIRRTVESQFNGRLELDWAPDGLCVTLEAPLARLAL